MFPYIYIDPKWFGGIEPFGVLVAIGVLFGAELARRHAYRTGLNLEELRRLAFYTLLFGFVFAHLVDVFFYQPGWWDKDKLLPLKLWAGISSYGGFFGGVLGFVFYWKVRSGKNRLPPDEPGRLAAGHGLAYADAAAYGALGGWVFGRLACAVVHDHVGKPTDFVLAVKFEAGNPSGIPAGTFHDLGLYEFLYLLLLCVAFVLWLRRPRREGLVLGAFAVAYTVPRFFFEFLRWDATDPRYLGLTPAQWFSVAGFLAGVWFLRFALTRSEPAPESYKAYDKYLEIPGTAEEE